LGYVKVVTERFGHEARDAGAGTRVRWTSAWLEVR
jgi:hypothetical protein